MEGNPFTNPTSLPPLPDGWNVLAVEDLCENVTTGGTPLRSNPLFFVGGHHSWFKTGELHDGKLFEAEEKITDEALAQSSAKLFPRNTVLMAMYGDGKTITSLGLLAREAATNQACCAMIPDLAVCEPRFLFYSLKCHRQDFIRLASGGAQRNLSGKLIRRFALSIPPIEEQRVIAHILGTLDDKIELNRRMNETLEAMARALFKSWFVDFDTVRAKAEGRGPVLPESLADLFPDSFEDSELGDIPRGWEVSVLDQLTDVVLGGDWGGDEQDAERLASARCIRGADIPDLQIGGTGKMPIRFLKSSSLAKRKLNDGDLVIEISGGSPTQSTGRPVLVSRELLARLDLPLVCSNFCRLLKPKSPIFSKFIYLWLRSLYANDEFLQFENGTTGIKNLAFTLFSSRFKFCVPPTAILEAFDLQVTPLFTRQQAGAAESDTLAALRDALLPKLVSGELRVENADRLLESV